MMKQNIKQLATQVHKLKPVILIGSKGLTEAVQLEIDRALEDHELIKIRISGSEKTKREDLIQEICQAQRAILIKKIGHIIAIYRKRKKSS